MHLISVQRLAEAENCIVVYGADFCVIQDLISKKPIGTGDMRNGVYYFKASTGGASFAAISSKETILWHQRLGHPSARRLSTISISCEFQFNEEALRCCDVCHRAKQTRNLFSLSNARANEPFSLIHCDLWGRCHTPSSSGCHYFLYIVDDFSRATWVFLLIDKSETCNRIVEFCSMVRTQFGGSVQ